MQIDPFDRDSLFELSRCGTRPRVSLMLATHPAGPESEQDAVRLRNLLRQAETTLAADWMRRPDAEEWLAPARQLPQDPLFWQDRGQGLAVFIAAELFRTYRIPITVPEYVSVAERFHLRPLLPLLEGRPSFWILVISENQVALYRSDERALSRLEVPTLPRNLQESLNYDSVERGAQVHSGAAGPLGKQAAVFHGQGGRPDHKGDDLRAYCRQINKAVTAGLGPAQEPLLLACVESLAAIYRGENTYSQLVDVTFKGSHDHLSESQLHAGALSVMQPLLKSEAASVAAQYQRHVGTSKSCDDVRSIVSAAIQGRVLALFYDPKAELYGESDSTGVDVQVTGKADATDLVELAAVETLEHGGSVHSMSGQELSTNAPLAALLRY